MMAIAANYNRILIEPYDFSLEYDFTKLYPFGVYTISPYMFDSLMDMMPAKEPVCSTFKALTLLVKVVREV